MPRSEQVAASLLSLVLALVADHTAHAGAAVRASPEADRQARSACASRSARNLVANRFGRVVLRNAEVFACPRRERPLSLGAQYAAPVSSSGGGGLTRVGLNGRTAAYAEEVEGGAQGYSYVVTAVVALRSRRVVFTHQYYGTESSGRFPVDAADLALCRNGRVAFIGGFRLFGPPPMEMSQLLEVRLSVGRGTVLLDRGPHVEAGSLRATDRHLDWRTDGAVKAVRVGCPAPTASVRVPDAPFG